MHDYTILSGLMPLTFSLQSKYLFFLLIDPHLRLPLGNLDRQIFNEWGAGL